jgi:hypothetical protein
MYIKNYEIIKKVKYTTATVVALSQKVLDAPSLRPGVKYDPKPIFTKMKHFMKIGETDPRPDERTWSTRRTFFILLPTECLLKS